MGHKTRLESQHPSANPERLSCHLLGRQASLGYLSGSHRASRFQCHHDLDNSTGFGTDSRRHRSLKIAQLANQPHKARSNGS